MINSLVARRLRISKKLIRRFKSSSLGQRLRPLKRVVSSPSLRRAVSTPFIITRNWLTFTVPVDSLLLGGESMIPAAEYAVASGEFLRPSTPIRRSPYFELLAQFGQMGQRIFERHEFSKTSYFSNAMNCIGVTGKYFEAESSNEIVRVAEKFIQREYYREDPAEPAQAGHAPAGKRILVCPVADSKCYQVLEENQRAAGAAFRGGTEVPVEIVGMPVMTPAQALLHNVRWQWGRAELYQPIDLPEVSTWTVVRRCVDRFSLMHDFLSAIGLRTGRYLDLGCSYGWFVREFAKAGFDAHGVDEDPAAIEVGRRIYGIAEGATKAAQIPLPVENGSMPFDVVSLFSVLHHFILGRGPCTAENLIQSIDKITKRVLFIDSGQAHEAWHQESLREWDANKLQNWLGDNTSFSRIVRLGTDLDNVGPFRENYGRTLFACVR